MRTITAALGALALVSAGAVAFTAPVAADEVWVQAYQRSGPEAACPSPVDETPWQDSFTGQREWTPSWAQWANHGTGGWVCQREIVWARSAPGEAGICAHVDKSNYLLFGLSRVVAAGTDFYSDPSCATVDPGSGSFLAFVYADTLAQAQALCDVVSPGLTPGNTWSDPRVWDCGA